MAQYVASLEKLAARMDAVFYPTHGSPIAAPQDHVRELILHRRQRAAQIADAVGARQRQRGGAGGGALSGIVPALRAAAAAQVKAHLDQLEKEGAVLRDGLSYRPAP